MEGGSRTHGYVPNPLLLFDPLGLAVCSLRYDRYKAYRDAGFSVQDAAKMSKGMHEGYFVSLMGARGPRYYNKPEATLGAPGSEMWLAPAEDYTGVSNRAAAVTATGHAPSVRDSYLYGDHMYGIAVPKDAVTVRPPASTDGGANRHWRLGGYTWLYGRGKFSDWRMDEQRRQGGRDPRRSSNATWVGIF